MKISAMIVELGSNGFWMMAQTPDDKENLLRTACSAWNIACSDYPKRKHLIDVYVNEYKRINNSSSETCANLRNNIKLLIERKDLLFPDKMVNIVSSRVIYLEGEERVEIASHPI